MLRRTGLSLLLLSCLSLAACNERPPTARSPLGPAPAEPQRSGDSAVGYKALVNNAYVTCGIPDAAYRKTAAAPKPEQRLPGRDGRNAELPYGLTSYVTPKGVELVTSNCLGCHAGYINGRLVVGLGNEAGDFTGDYVLNAESVGAYVNGKEEAAEWRKWADRIAAIAPYITTDTVGVNPANNLTLALFAHRDPKTLAWSQQPLLEPPPTRPLPVSVPPWWNMRKKHAQFYSTEGRGDQARFMMTAATLCTDTVEEAKAIDSYFPDIRAYIASLTPPPYPFAVKRDLAEQGRAVFEEHCGRCHGDYGPNGKYPNLVVGLDKVGTDPALAQGAYEQADRFIDWFNRSFFGEIARAAPALGYIAPPLDGVWATAPYLHNGSVPTIAALLDSAKRPKYWTRRFDDSKDYNEQALGWNYTALSYGKAGAKSPEERKKIYDTTLSGYSNQGHTFGDKLTEEQRAAVLEYLKIL